MILINFSHPLTSDQLHKLKVLLKKNIEKVIELKVHFDSLLAYSDQIAKLVDDIDLTPRQWQKEALIINPPSFNFIAVALLAELHGRMGYFPSCIRLRPIEGSLPSEFEIAEIINLQEIREIARKKR